MAGNILWQVFEFVVLLCMGLYCKCLCLFYCVSMELYGKCLCLLSYCVWNLSICCRIMYVTLWQVFVVLLCMGLYSKCLSYFCLGLYGKCLLSYCVWNFKASVCVCCPSVYRTLWQMFVLLCTGLYSKCLLSYCVWDFTANVCCPIVYGTLWQMFIVLLCMGLCGKCLCLLSYCVSTMGLYGKCVCCPVVGFYSKCLCLLSYSMWDFMASVCCPIVCETLWQVFVVL